MFMQEKKEEEVERTGNSFQIRERTAGFYREKSRMFSSDGQYGVGSYAGRLRAPLREETLGSQAGREIFCDPQRLFPGGFRGTEKGDGRFPYHGQPRR